MKCVHPLSYLVFAVTLNFGALSLFADQILYDYTKSIQETSFIGSSEFGEIIFLDDPSAIRKLSMVLRGTSPGFTEDLMFRFYTATSMNPNTALPGELFASRLVEDVQVTNSIQLHEFQFPRVKVPPSFFFTVEPLNGNSLWKYAASDGYPSHVGENGRKFQDRGGSGFRRGC
jgi:hypothetical protein